jgi:AcrR family transcriptional regulator
MSPGHRKGARLSADARRESIVAAATRVFARTGYGSSTTAVIAAEAEVNEALLFRHLGSKTGIYLACIDAMWARVQAAAQEHFGREPAGEHWKVPGRVFLQLLDRDPHDAQLWVRALVESSAVVEIDVHLEAFMHEVHAWVEEAFARSADAGALRPGAAPPVHAWVALAIALLGSSLATRGIIDRAQLQQVVELHRDWVTGSASA